MLKRTELAFTSIMALFQTSKDSINMKLLNKGANVREISRLKIERIALGALLLRTLALASFHYAYHGIQRRARPLRQRLIRLSGLPASY